MHFHAYPFRIYREIFRAQRTSANKLYIFPRVIGKVESVDGAFNDELLIIAGLKSITLKLSNSTIKKNFIPRCKLLITNVIYGFSIQNFNHFNSVERFRELFN